MLHQMSRQSRKEPDRLTLVKDLVAKVAFADRAPGRAEAAERKLKELADPRCIKFLLPVLVQQYPPWQATDSAIRILHALKASRLACQFLTGKLKDRQWRTRATAAAVLESFANSNAATALVVATRDRNIDVSIMAIHSLWVWSLSYPKLGKLVYDVCHRAIRHSSHGVRGAAFGCLSHMNGVRCDELISRAAQDPHPQIRQMSSWWLQERRRIKSEKY